MIKINNSINSNKLRKLMPINKPYFKITNKLKKEKRIFSKLNIIYLAVRPNCQATNRP